MKVKYIGPKPRKGIVLPIGVRNVSSRIGVVWADPFAELSDDDARKLIQWSPADFQIVGEAEGEKEEIAPVKKKLGRPKGSKNKKKKRRKRGSGKIPYARDESGKIVRICEERGKVNGCF